MTQHLSKSTRILSTITIAVALIATSHANNVVTYEQMRNEIEAESPNISRLVNLSIKDFSENKSFYTNGSIYTKERSEKVINALRKHARNLKTVLNKLIEAVKMKKKEHCCACARFHETKTKK